MVPKTPPNSKCEVCDQHDVMEERMKLLDNIPKLLTWMNAANGGIKVLTVFACLCIAGVFTIVSVTRSEMHQTQKEHEATISDTIKEMKESQAKWQEDSTCTIDEMAKSMQAIEKNVVVLVKTFELNMIAAEKERLHDRVRIDKIEDYLNRNGARLKP